MTVADCFKRRICSMMTRLVSGSSSDVGSSSKYQRRVFIKGARKRHAALFAAGKEFSLAAHGEIRAAFADKPVQPGGAQGFADPLSVRRVAGIGHIVRNAAVKEVGRLKGDGDGAAQPVKLTRHIRMIDQGSCRP